jgi:formate dehydrogenase subunit gamma
MGTTRDDNEVTLETAECLGLCKSAPVVEVNDQPHVKVTAESFEGLLRSLGVG